MRRIIEMIVSEATHSISNIKTHLAFEICRRPHLYCFILVICGESREALITHDISSTKIGLNWCFPCLWYSVSSLSWFRYTLSLSFSFLFIFLLSFLLVCSVFMRVCMCTWRAEVSAGYLPQLLATLFFWDRVWCLR